MRTVPVFTVDAFTSVPFSGNPCAVVLVEEELDAGLMQSIAAEMNLSETAFILPRNKTAGTDPFAVESEFDLRWFTPTCEVPLCGHGTMASAATIVSGRSNTSPVITFHTLSGALVVQCNGGSIEMKLPRNEPVDVDAAQDAEVIALVCGDLPVKTARLCSNTKKLLLQLEDATPRDALEALRPDTVAMSRAHDGSRYRGVIVTTTGNGKPGSYDFISRYFAPWNGIAEDPVTGSAHTVLGPHWATVLGKTELRARQCSARGGDVTVVVAEDSVSVSGEATIVMEGILRLPQ